MIGGKSAFEDHEAGARQDGGLAESGDLFLGQAQDISPPPQFDVPQTTVSKLRTTLNIDHHTHLFHDHVLREPAVEIAYWPRIINNRSRVFRIENMAGPPMKPCDNGVHGKTRRKYGKVIKLFWINEICYGLA